LQASHYWTCFVSVGDHLLQLFSLSHSTQLIHEWTIWTSKKFFEFLK
jgi:hypothetical protein